MTLRSFTSIFPKRNYGFLNGRFMFSTVLSVDVVNNLTNQTGESISKNIPTQIDQRIYATGRRKSSVARVWIVEGSGMFKVNKQNMNDYFAPLQRKETLLPFLATKTSGIFDVWCTVKGGGISGQAGAVRLGVSRALVNYDKNLKSILREDGLMTRDARRVERKKPGQKKARKKYQWVKR